MYYTLEENLEYIITFNPGSSFSKTHPLTADKCFIGSVRAAEIDIGVTSDH